jgi:hypothetical protein
MRYVPRKLAGGQQHTLGSTRATNFGRTVRSLRFQPVHKILRVKANRTAPAIRSEGIIPFAVIL